MNFKCQPIKLAEPTKTRTICEPQEHYVWNLRTLEYIDGS